MKFLLRIALYSLPLGALLFSCVDDPPPPGGGQPEARFRIARVSTTQAGETPGDYLFFYNDDNRIEFIFNEGRVIEDGRVTRYRFDWNNSKLESINIFAIGGDSIPVSDINLSYSGALLKSVQTIQYNPDGSVSAEAERTYIAQQPAIIRQDTGYFGNTQFSNRSQFSVLTGSDDIRTYENNEIKTRTNNLQLTYEFQVFNPILSLRLPPAYLPEIVDIFGLLTAEMPEIMLEAELLPTSIRNNFSEDGLSNSETQEWQYGFASATRISDMRTDDITVIIEWTEY